MNTVNRDIFRAIHEGKWLSIEYKNSKEEVTKYWISIKNIDLFRKSLLVDGLHLTQYIIKELHIYIDSILTSVVIEGSFYDTNRKLVEDIKINADKYKSIFRNTANLKILNYLADCNKLDTTPYQCEYSLITKFDGDCMDEGDYQLAEEQFKEIVSTFQKETKNNSPNQKIKSLCLNVMSINTKKGLYVLAYKNLRFNVKGRTLKAALDITVSKEFTVDGVKQSVRKFLDADDFYLLENFEENKEIIKDSITKSNPNIHGIDDMPYLIAIGRDVILELNAEYAAIVAMYEEDKVTVPIKAFFGDLVKQPIRKKEYSIALLNKKINLDQLLAIHNAIKYPLAYIQGPPGTGKTNTIINTMITAFFNEKSVLFTSFNNHPIDNVCEALQKIKYKDKIAPFPIIRLGNNEKIGEALDYIKNLCDRVKSIQVFKGTLEKNKDVKIARMQQLTELLQKHEEILDLKERKEAIERLLKMNNNLTFQVELQGIQLEEVNHRLAVIGEVRDEEALKLIAEDEEDFKKYLYYTSARYIKKLEEPKNKDILDIIDMEDRALRINEFNRYLSQSENLRKFIKIFPIVSTTCISAHKLGEPEPYFDMVVMDEASQANTAVSLVPIIRGENLMLVGDPQQLNPVILLEQKDNAKLRKNYSVPDEYDYVKNSIYKTFLACDSISGEILLSHHYRCNKRIIGFNNKKYYNNKLVIQSNSREQRPLLFMNVEDNVSFYKNTSPAEAEQIVQYAKKNQNRRIGVITPFTNQKELINRMLKEGGVENVTCGTVHAFQGDEKDEILFSMALTDKTSSKTYEWLKNNKELLNVATSRAKDKLILLSSNRELERLHQASQIGEDDVYELVQYVKNNGQSEVTAKINNSRALGIKPYSTETEEAFLENLNHALDNVLNTNKKCIVHKEVGIAHVFQDNMDYNDLFYSGRFDFVVYEKDYAKREVPILAIELDGKEHFEDMVVKERDKKKNAICRQHGFELIRIENSYARRYNFIKEILIHYFEGVRKV